MSSARRLAAGRLISLTSGSAAYIALIAGLYEQTGSAAWVSAALFAALIARRLPDRVRNEDADQHDRPGEHDPLPVVREDRL
jgi:hypothetical protein